MSQPAAYRAAAEHAPAGVRGGMHAVRLDPGQDEVVVFLLGMRVNRWRRPRSWLPVLTAMPRMLRQLQKDPDLGLLRANLYANGRNFVAVQYWRSSAQLYAFARAPELTHAPAWGRFNRRAAGTSDVGIWHETFVVPAEAVEARYGNMPPFGLGGAFGVGAGRLSAC